MSCNAWMLTRRKFKWYKLHIELMHTLILGFCLCTSWSSNLKWIHVYQNLLEIETFYRKSSLTSFTAGDC